MGWLSDRDRRRLTSTPPGWAVVAVLALTGSISSFMSTLMVPIQAELPTLLNATRHDTAWVVTVTILGAAIATPIAGKLGDMFGKRRVLLGLLVALTVGSVVAATSTTLVGVLIGRALQGTVMGSIPLGIAILRDVIHRRHLASTVGLLSATLGIGAALGMPVAAAITETMDWHYLFWVSAALGAVMFALVIRIVPVSTLRTSGRFDLAGALGLAAGLSAILIAISRGNVWGWLAPETLAFAVGGIVLLLLWGWHQWHAREPLLDLRVAARPPVLLTNIASVGIGFAFYSAQVVFPQLLELPPRPGVGFGLSLVQASLIVMASGIVQMMIAPVGGILARRFGPRIPLSGGAAAVVLAYLCAHFFGTSVWRIAISVALVGLGIGLSFAAMPMLIMRAVSAEETGASNGLNALFRSVGTSTASAVMGAVLASVTVSSGRLSFPTTEAFQLCYWIAGCVALTTLVLTFFIPSASSGSQSRPSIPSD